MGPREHRKEVASIGMEPGIAERDRNDAIVTNKTSHRPQHRNRIVIMLETIDGYDDVRRLSQFSHELTAISDACLSGCRDRKSTRLNSSHRCISYAVFCLKKKTKKYNQKIQTYNKTC